jgi:hypothetical protein
VFPGLQEVVVAVAVDAVVELGDLEEEAEEDEAEEDEAEDDALPRPFARVSCASWCIASLVVGTRAQGARRQDDGEYAVDS